jgi:hypothetical protein
MISFFKAFAIVANAFFLHTSIQSAALMVASYNTTAFAAA